MSSSPFASKLGSNYCPQDEEIAEIQALIAEQAHRLKSLDDEISNLHKTLDQLTEERAKVGAYVDAHRALISPARRLPLDIIHEIFLACIPTHRNCVMSAKEAPVLLGRICSPWRIISLSTPRLWSSLHIPIPYMSPDMAHAVYEGKLAQRLETAKAWLSRSGECPLSISLHFPHWPGSDQIEISVVQTLVPFASHWEHIGLVARPSILATLSHLTEEDVPRLKSATLRGLSEFPGDTPGNASSVVSLRLLGGPEVSSIAMTDLPFSLEAPLRWNNLANLSIIPGFEGAPLTSQTALQLFSSCPALAICELEIRDSPDAGSAQGQPILGCSSMNWLVIKVMGALPVTVRTLFSRLSLPGLRHLKFTGHLAGDDSVSYSPSLFASAPCLESLEMNLGLFSKSTLTEFLLNLTHTVRRLHLDEFPRRRGMYTDVFDDDVWAALIAPPGFPGPWLSSVQELEINECNSFSDEALLRFIKSRMAAQGLSFLKRVAIRFSRGLQLDILPELQPFMETGLRIELTYISIPPWRVSPWEGLSDDPYRLDY